MRRTLLAVLFLLPAVAVQAQDDSEALIAGLDQVLYCATTFTILSVHPDAPAEAAEDYDAASTELYTVAYSAMSEGGMEDDAISEITDAYAEEVKTHLQTGELRFTEEDCQGAREMVAE